MAEKKPYVRPHRQAKAVQAPAFPQTLVRVKRAAGGGFEVESLIVDTAEAEQAALKDGYVRFIEPPVPALAAYPAWRYHPSHGARLVQSAVEDEKLGPEWRDTPAPDEPEEKPRTRDAWESPRAADEPGKPPQT